MSEAQANPYNAKKSWHDGKEEQFVSSESLFFDNQDPSPEPVPEPDATLNEATHDWKKRYDELKKHHDSTITRLRQDVRDMQAQMEVRQAEPTPQVEPSLEMQEYVKNNPQLTEVVENLTSNKTSKIEQELEEIKARERRLMQREAAAYLQKTHPDFSEIKEDPAFHNWAEAQPQNIQDWIYNNPYDGELAARAITLYKADMGLVNPKDVEEPKTSQAEPDAATLVPTRNTGTEISEGKRIWSRREIEKMPMQVYEQYEAEIDQAIAEGRITA